MSGAGNALLDSGQVVDDVGQGQNRTARGTRDVTLANATRQRKRGNVPAVILVTDESRLADPAAVMDTLPPGTGVWLRHYAAPEREALARRLAVIARRRRLVLVVAGADWRLAARIGAAGVHLPEAVARSANLAGLRLWLRHRRMLSVAAHSRTGLNRAVRLGADCALLSPVFATASHPGAVTLGAIRFAQWAQGAGLPVIALGGVNAATARKLRFAAGLAAIGGFQQR
ncbi:MAG: thiamine phosphate synthase [Rhodospirillaceae bacterium]|nr:thiamine phosphate synthase [Rhodospirillales bacterium]